MLAQSVAERVGLRVHGIVQPRRDRRTRLGASGFQFGNRRLKAAGIAARRGLFKVLRRLRYAPGANAARRALQRMRRRRGTSRLGTAMR